MMTKAALIPCLALFALFTLAGCNTAIRGNADVAEYNAQPLSMPIPSDVSGSVLEDAMKSTFQGRHWTVISSSSDKVTAVLNHNGYEAKASMVREGDTVKIYSDSTMSDPKTGEQIQAVPLGWLENLQKDFPRRLAQAS